MGLRKDCTKILITTKQLKHFDQTEFINDLLLVDWKGIVSNGDDINLIVEQWNEMFSLILEKHAPVRNRRVSEKFSPWLTKDLNQLSATRDRLKKTSSALQIQNPDGSLKADAEQS